MSEGRLLLLDSLGAAEPGRRAAGFLGILHRSDEWSLKEVGSTEETETHFLTEMPYGERNWGARSPILSPNSPPLHTLTFIILRISKVFLKALLHDQLIFSSESILQGGKNSFYPFI